MSWKCQCVRARPACAREEMAPRATFFFPLEHLARNRVGTRSPICKMWVYVRARERRSIRKFSQQRFHLVASIRETQDPSSSCFWLEFFCLPSELHLLFIITIQGHIKGKHSSTARRTPVDVKTNLKSYFYNSIRGESRLDVFKRIQHRCLKKLLNVTISLFDKPPKGDAGWL